MPLVEGLIFLNKNFGFGLMSEIWLWSYTDPEWYLINSTKRKMVCTKVYHSGGSLVPNYTTRWFFSSKFWHLITMQGTSMIKDAAFWNIKGKFEIIILFPSNLFDSFFVLMVFFEKIWGFKRKTMFLGWKKSVR